MTHDSPHKLSTQSIALHWLVALGIIALLAMGIYMEENEVYSLYPWHKSFGFVIFFLVAYRVLWRIINGWPQATGEHKPAEKILAKISHWVLILGTLAMPLSGFFMSAMGGNGVDVFGINVFPRNPDPANPERTIAISRSAASFFHSAHGIIANVMIITLIAHIAGAVKHHVIDKDGTLKRMLGKTV